jgi:hypothetical protein
MEPVLLVYYIREVMSSKNVGPCNSERRKEWIVIGVKIKLHFVII